MDEILSHIYFINVYASQKSVFFGVPRVNFAKNVFGRFFLYGSPMSHIDIKDIIDININEIKDLYNYIIN